MAFLHSLPAPHSLEINDSNVAEKWAEWKEMWEHYSVASKVNKEERDVQVAALLTAIETEARKVFKTWNLTATQKKDIKGVLERFANIMLMLAAFDHIHMLICAIQILIIIMCRLVESKRCCPILGKSACEGMGVVEIKDSDAIRRPDTSGGQVFSVQDVMPPSKEQVMDMFPDVFDEGLGLLEGEYHIRLSDSARPIQHAPRRGQVVLREKIKESLEELHSSGVIKPFTTPMPWISSMFIYLALSNMDRNTATAKANYCGPGIYGIYAQRPDHNTGNYVPYSLRTVSGFFNVPQSYLQTRFVRRGPTVYRPYPRRLESLTICRCQS